ncbi:hypothetical protein BZA05DRAFT_435433 [Tricharina praecox]|uniref:uncharacterized protein n=1 Tax=Tricharina praecox TaxID=43433 RepID=UPI00221FF28E|nr:uncharacterized protein BZA05DRAFT_435433 [Tricharina praecox]KAI5854453.1 hypothetical protein BZA05DRAFT_435433 [Tricharina praecox]
MFAARGVEVVVLDLNPLRAEAEQNPRIHYFRCNVRDDADVVSTANAVKDKHGDPTVIINNAGVKLIAIVCTYKADGVCDIN